MTTAEFKQQCVAFGIATPADLARTLRIDGGGTHRIWKGERPVSARTVRLLAAAKQALPRALSALEIRLLSGVEHPPKVGSRVPEPVPRTNFEMAISWEPVYEALEAEGLLRYSRRAACFQLTAAGVKAVNYYRATESRGRQREQERAGVAFRG